MAVEVEMEVAVAREAVTDRYMADPAPRPLVAPTKCTSLTTSTSVAT